ncbi:MAG: hypothetical protein WD601_10695, partial [Pseudohongiellaceae bacterium]
IIGFISDPEAVGIAVQEVLEFAGCNSNHIAIRTASYFSIGERTRVSVYGLDFLSGNLATSDKLLIVDDVYDTGLSLAQVIDEMQLIYGSDMPEFRIATPYFKPANNLTSRQPDYYLHATDNWLVFPHELIGLSRQEINEEKPGIAGLRERLVALMAGK